MQACSADTDPDVDRIHMELLRRAGAGRRAQMALSLSADVIGLARLGIRRSSGEPGLAEIGLRFVERHYGPELASGLRRHLATRRS